MASVCSIKQALIQIPPYPTGEEIAECDSNKLKEVNIIYSAGVQFNCDSRDKPKFVIDDYTPPLGDIICWKHPHYRHPDFTLILRTAPVGFPP